MKLLLVEANAKRRRFLSRALSEQGHVIDLCDSGPSVVHHASALVYDLVVLGSLPQEEEIPGICRAVRHLGQNSGILVLRSRADPATTAALLDAGADDCLSPPCPLEELLARVRAILRRTRQSDTLLLRAGPISIDPCQRTVGLGNQKLHLTPREFQLLSLLVRNAGRIVSRTEILNMVWDLDHEPGSNVVDAHVRRIRLRLGRAAQSLETVRGQGYRIRLEPATKSTARIHPGNCRGCPATRRARD